METIYLGTELKLAVQIECEGFDMDSNEWTAQIFCGKNKSEPIGRDTGAVKVGGQWCVLIDTKSLGAGLYWLVTAYDVPDSDFPDGYRHVVKKQALFNVEGVCL